MATISVFIIKKSFLVNPAYLLFAQISSISHSLPLSLGLLLFSVSEEEKREKCMWRERRKWRKQTMGPRAKEKERGPDRTRYGGKRQKEKKCTHNEWDS